MNSVFSGPQFLYLIVAFLVLGLSFAGIVWIGRQIRGELGPGASSGGGDLGGLAMMETIPPAMMKEAIGKGLIVPSQLAGMTPVERTFLFASIKQKLTPAVAAADAAPSPIPRAAPIAPLAAPIAAPPAIPAGVPPEMLAILNAEKLRAWCPMCGTELQLPAFPPLLARCTKCGMKSAIRQEEGGRYVVIVSPPAKI